MHIADKKPSRVWSHQEERGVLRKGKLLAQLIDRLAVGICAVLLLAIAGITFAAVTARFAFHSPFVWSDELISILFVWLACLGAVVAFKRGEHTRMTYLFSRVSSASQAKIRIVSSTITATFFIVLLPAAFHYALDEMAFMQPSLGLPAGVSAFALPVSIGLMLFLCLIQLASELQAHRKWGIFFCILIGLVALSLGKSIFLQLGNYNLILFFVVFTAIGIFVSIPISVTFGLATLGYLALSTRVPLSIVVNRMEEAISQPTLIAVPLFVLLGVLIEATGMAKALITFLASLIGHMRGGLHYVLMVAMYMVSGISGSKVADMAAVVPPLFPEMEQRGADTGDLVALLSATGAQTETVPPGVVMITMGSIAGVSIAGLFTGGVLPAIIMGLALAVVVFYRQRHQLRVASKASVPVIGRAFIAAVPALILPFVIRSAVVEGVATPTEVSTIGIAIVLLFALALSVTRSAGVNWETAVKGLESTAILTGVILFTIATASAMAWGLTQSGFARQLATVIHLMPGGTIGFMTISIVVFATLGSVLEGLPAIVLLAPIMFPIARSFHIHDVHYAVVAIFSMGIGLFMPPFGIGYYTACAIAKVDNSKGLPWIGAYFLALLAGLAVIAAVPWISTGFLGR